MNKGRVLDIIKVRDDNISIGKDVEREDIVMLNRIRDEFDFYLNRDTVDHDSFIRYFRSRWHDSNISCINTQDARKKAKALGFNENSILGEWAVLMIDYFFDNYKDE